MSGLFRRDRYIHIKGVSEEEKTANKFKIISRLTEKKEKKAKKSSRKLSRFSFVRIAEKN